MAAWRVGGAGAGVVAASDDANPASAASPARGRSAVTESAAAAAPPEMAAAERAIIEHAVGDIVAILRDDPACRGAQRIVAMAEQLPITFANALAAAFPSSTVEILVRARRPKRCPSRRRTGSTSRPVASSRPSTPG